MRITHSQIIELEKAITNSNLDLKQFDRSGADEEITYRFKGDYFSYTIMKASSADYRVTYLAVHSKEPLGKSFSWESLILHFSKWCDNIYEDIESGKKLFNPNMATAAETKIDPMSPVIKKISPKFDLIFMQAFQAEEYGLNEICGLGYRKAFEFLIKDYVMRGMTKEQSLEIKNMGITDVVRKHILDTGIQLILHRVLWLGNDHAHYLPVWKKKTINDLKQLIYTTVSWIEANEQLAKINKHALKIEKLMPFRAKKK